MPTQLRTRPASYDTNYGGPPGHPSRHDWRRTGILSVGAIAIATAICTYLLTSAQPDPGGPTVALTHTTQLPRTRAALPGWRVPDKKGGHSGGSHSGSSSGSDPKSNSGSSSSDDSGDSGGSHSSGANASDSDSHSSSGDGDTAGGTGANQPPTSSTPSAGTDIPPTTSPPSGTGGGGRSTVKLRCTRQVSPAQLNQAVAASQPGDIICLQSGTGTPNAPETSPTRRTNTGSNRPSSTAPTTTPTTLPPSATTPSPSSIPDLGAGGFGAPTTTPTEPSAPPMDGSGPGTGRGGLAQGGQGQGWSIHLPWIEMPCITVPNTAGAGAGGDTTAGGTDLSPAQVTICGADPGDSSPGNAGGGTADAPLVEIPALPQSPDSSNDPSGGPSPSAPGGALPDAGPTTTSPESGDGGGRAGSADRAGDESAEGSVPSAGGTPLTGASKSITAQITGYSFQDNTPPGSAIISMPVMHSKAGGSGTYADPITTAVPGSASGPETPKGTRIYVAKLKRYFIVEDSGATKEGTTHFDLYVDGQGFSKSDSAACASSYTGSAQVILNPPPNLPVTPGPLTGAGGCKV